MKEKEEAEENKSKKMGKKVRNGTRRRRRRNLIHIEEDYNYCLYFVTHFIFS